MVGYAATARAALVSMIAAAGLIGCAEYVDRKETIAFSAGNAVQTNIVTHVTDPWPKYARNKDFAVNGQRMQRAIENYRCGTTPGGSNDDANGDGAAAGLATPPPAQRGQPLC